VIENRVAKLEELANTAKSCMKAITIVGAALGIGGGFAATGLNGARDDIKDLKDTAAGLSKEFEGWSKSVDTAGRNLEQRANTVAEQAVENALKSRGTAPLGMESDHVVSQTNAAARSITVRDDVVLVATAVARGRSSGGPRSNISAIIKIGEEDCAKEFNWTPPGHVIEHAASATCVRFIKAPEVPARLDIRALGGGDDLGAVSTELQLLAVRVPK
jgi:hypothetical protein